MTRRAPIPAQLAAHPFRVADAMAAGVTRGRLRARDLAAPHRGIRVGAGASNDIVARCRAYATARAPNRVFSHVTAARLLGLPLPWKYRPSEPLHVTAWGGARTPRGAGVRGHQTRSVPRRVTVEGVATLAPADAWCSLAPLLDLESLIVAGERLLHPFKPLATVGQIDAAIARYGDRRGARTLRLAREQMRACSASPRETKLRRRAVAAGYPEPEPNGRIVLPGGRIAFGDLVYRRYQVILEYDGEHHLEYEQWQRDIDRLNALAAAGWLVVRVERGSDLRAVLGYLDAALRLRGWRPG